MEYTVNDQETRSTAQTTPHIIPPVTTAANSVRLSETGGLFDTLADAIAAGSAQLNSFTLEIIGDVMEPNNVYITSNVTIIGANGAHTIAMSPGRSIYVQNGGSLTLGAGTGINPLTITSTGVCVRVENGTIAVKQGITLSSGNYALYLIGSNVNGTISGGNFESNIALWMADGARLNEISGGVFTGRESAVHMSGNGTRIDRISDGTFSKTDASIDRSGFYVQDYSQIGEISGGHFDSVGSGVLLIIRGGWVEKISGGEFASLSSAINGGIHVYADGWGKTGVGTLSNTHVIGGFIGIWIYGDGSQINTITGGTFESVRAMENDIGGVITSILGGNFIGEDYGILNVGTIENIGGQARILGKNRDGLYNYPNSHIDEISGGTIESYALNGIRDYGTIVLISGGTIIGEQSAINCVASTPINNGKIGTISGGVFWGKNDTAIILAYSVLLEPGLTAAMGAGRYWGKDGVIFNDESLVIYPYNAYLSMEYHMSTETVPVTGIPGVGFKYLTLNGPAALYTVRVNGSYAANTGAGNYPEGDIVTINAGSRMSYAFAGWTVNAGGVMLADANSPITTFIMPASNVTVTANWRAETPAPEPTSPVEIQACKTVCGACLCAGMFTFGVFDHNGDEVARAMNDGCGNIFLQLGAFAQVGSFTYTVRELNPSGCGWVMDTRTYPAIVTVKDNGAGQLIANVGYPNGRPEFINHYRAFCNPCRC